MTREAATADPVTRPRRSVNAAARAASTAMLARDLTGLRKRPGEFVARTIVQPFLFVFVLGYVNPKIGLGPSSGAGANQLATTLLAGMLAIVTLFQGIQAVALPLVQEFGYTREIEDRVLAPLPVSLVALEKVIAAAFQGLLAALVVFPLALLIPSGHPSLHLDWPVLLTIAPLSALACGALGLFFGTTLDPRSITAMFAILLTPLLFLGCTLYPWSALDSVKWVQDLSLANPLTYVSEGYRAAVTTSDHLSLLVIYPVLVAFTALLLRQGTRNFQRRVVA
jgi:ABC-2 type transport system permease protein